MYQIEKEIPLPVVVRGASVKYPFEQMTVNDSFFVPYKSFVFVEGTPPGEIEAAEKKAQQVTYNSIARSKSAFVKAYPAVQLTMRKVEGGVRVWRTA